MKKSHFIFSILAFSFVMGTAINLPTFAATDNIIATSNRDEVTAALQSVRDLPGYNTYAQMDNATREQATPLFREYRYLAELVKTGEGLLADPTASAEDLNMIVRAANDAVKGCKLIFANANTNSSSNQPTTRPISNPINAATEASSSSASASVATIDTPTPTTPSETTPVITETTANTPETPDTPAQVETPEAPAAETKNNTIPTALAHATTAFTAFGALAATNQRRFHKNRA